MFLGLTKLYRGPELLGDISEIKKGDDGKTWIFKMWDGGKVYRSDKVTMLDIILGAGERITIPD